MTSTRKIAVIFTAVIMIALLAVGAFMVSNHYKEIREIGIKDNIPYGFGKKARVVILAGQSNAAGCSHDPYLQKNVTEEKYAEYKEGYDNVYINFFASATNESQGFVKCSVKQGECYLDGCFGPELGMAEKLHELYPDETIFIIKWAWGGTNLYDQWRAPSGGTGAGPLFEGFIHYVKTSLRYLEAKNYDVRVEAMCWMQGESDSIEEATALSYGENLTHFISDVRAELSEYASEDGIAFIDAYIAASIFWTHYETINAEKQAVADSSEMNAVVDTIAHGLSVTEEPYDQPDIAHYDSMSEIKLGHLFALEASKYFN